jgi:hypothetical protein
VTDIDYLRIAPVTQLIYLGRPGLGYVLLSPSMLLLMIAPITLHPHNPVLQYLLLRIPDRMDWTGSPEWCPPL